MKKRLDKIEKVCYNGHYIGYDGWLGTERNHGVHRLYNSIV